MKESVTEFKADCDDLPDRLQLVLKNLGISEVDAGKTDRVRTAKAVKALLGACDGKEPTGPGPRHRPGEGQDIDTTTMGKEPEVGVRRFSRVFAA